MPDGFQFLDIVFFAMVAAFIALRLRSVLGRRTGNEPRPPESISSRQSDESVDNIVRLHEREPAPPRQEDDFSNVTDPALMASFKQIKRADPSFNREDFLQGACAAFEMVIHAYASGDSERLRPLVNDTVFQLFTDAMKERESAGEKLETTLVGLREYEIVEAALTGKLARITVRFVSDQINLIRDANDQIVQGDPGESVEVIDLWSFERETGTRDPNWKLVATSSAE